MGKKRGNCKKYGRSKSTGKCRIRPAASGSRRGSKLHRRGSKVGGTYKVACGGKRVYASSSESAALAAARAAAKHKGASCVVFTKTRRVAVAAP